MEVSGQLQASAALLPGKNPPLSKGVSGPQSQSVQFGEEKNLSAGFQNEKPHDLYTSKNIIQAIKSQRMMNRECGTYGGEERCIWGFGGET
jgi:hypothetical protein